MGQNSSKEPTYTGMDKYPGIISTVITIVILVVFVGALYLDAKSHHAAHGEEESEEAPAKTEAKN